MNLAVRGASVDVSLTCGLNRRKLASNKGAQDSVSTKSEERFVESMLGLLARIWVILHSIVKSV